MSEAPRYNEIDPGIVDVVRLLNDNGFQTIASCQGGEGHACEFPNVRIRLGISCGGTSYEYDNTRRRLCQFLLSKGFSGFSVKTVTAHQKTCLPEAYSFVEVEFWSTDFMPKEK